MSTFRSEIDQWAEKRQESRHCMPFWWKNISFIVFGMLSKILSQPPYLLLIQYTPLQPHFFLGRWDRSSCRRCATRWPIRPSLVLPHYSPALQPTEVPVMPVSAEWWDSHRQDLNLVVKEGVELGLHLNPQRWEVICLDHACCRSVFALCSAQCSFVQPREAHSVEVSIWDYFHCSHTHWEDWTVEGNMREIWKHLFSHDSILYSFTSLLPPQNCSACNLRTAPYFVITI